MTHMSPDRSSRIVGAETGARTVGKEHGLRGRLDVERPRGPRPAVVACRVDNHLVLADARVSMDGESNGRREKWLSVAPG